MAATSPIDGSTWIRRSSKILSTELEGEGVLLDPEAGTYFAVNPIGALVWRTLATPMSCAALIEATEAEVAVPLDRLDADVRRFVDQLVEHGLVEIVRSPERPAAP